jgi:chromosome segregation ATPase
MDPETEARFASLEQQASTLRGVATQHLLQNQEMGRQLTVLLGTVQGQESDIKVLLTRLEGIEGRLDVVSDRLSRLEARLDGMDAHLDGMSRITHEQFAAIKQRLDGGLDGMSERLDVGLGTLQERLETIVALLTGST